MNKQRYNIGLLVANVMDPFSNEVAKGAMLAAEQFDVNLTIFPAKYVDVDVSRFRDEQFEYQYNALLSYAATGKFDYIVACIGTIMYSSSEGRKKALADTYQGTPILCVCADIPGYENVQYDNRAGIVKAVDYLAKAGRKHICMMIGEETNEECRQRYAAYRETMEQNGLPHSEDMIMKSDLSMFCDKEVEDLLERNPQADAIICANDVIASVAYKIVKKRHKKIGDDIAIVGYDDLPFATKMNPPLASVNADASKLGFHSIQSVVNKLNGESDCGGLLETTFIPRDSCMYAEDSASGKKDIFLGTYEEIVCNVLRYVYGDNAMSDDLSDVKNFWVEFVALLQEYIVYGDAEEKDVNKICRLEEVYLGNSQYRDDRLLKALDVFEHAAVWVASESDDRESVDAMKKKMEAVDRIRKVAYRKLMGGVIADLGGEDNRSYHYIHNTNLVMRETLMLGGDLQKSYADILSKLHCLNVKRSYLYLLEEPKVYCDGEFAFGDVQWKFEAYQDGEETYVVPREKRHIRPNELYHHEYMPDGERHTYIAVDLFSREYQYGMLLCELDSDEVFKSLEFISYQMSAAVKVVDLLVKQESMLEELYTRNLVLEKESKVDELTGIYNRRGFYDAANEMISKEENAGRPMFVCYADMDNLKMVNDVFGHIEGDYSLKALADCMNTLFGEDGVVGRMGGDEFVAVVFKDLAGGQEEVISKKETLIQQLNASSSKPYRINMSMGIYECICGNAYDLKEAIDKADDKLYAIKVKRKKEI